MSFSNTFDTNCTLPTTPYHYVASPNFRSTTDILWSSWSSLVLFTWTVQHLNVPALREEKTWTQKCRNLIREIAIKIMFMLGTILAPELLIGKALADWISARTSKEEMEDFANEDEVKWTVTHAFYANLGGFIVKFSTDTPLPDQIDPENNSAGSNLLGVGSAQEYEAPHLELAKTKAPATSSSSSLIEEGKMGNIPQLIPRPQKCDIDFRKPHKLMSGKKCPCSDRATRSEYTYMSTEDIRAHHTNKLWPRLLYGDDVFFNGPFKVKIWIFCDCLEHPNEEGQTFIAGTINDEIVSQALYEAVRFPNADYCGEHMMIPKALNVLRGRFWTLDARQLYMARKLGIIEMLPDISEDALQDQSKGDVIIKLAAVFQALYLALMLILRRIQDLPSSLLELQVVAFAGSAFIAYLLFFSKPQGVRIPRYIKAARYPTPKDICTLAAVSPYEYPLPILVTQRRTYARSNFTMHYCNWSRLPASVLSCTGELAGPRILAIGSILGGMLFGAIHCAAVSRDPIPQFQHPRKTNTQFQWSSSFPTPIEKLLWRISCLFLVFIPLPCLPGVMTIGPVDRLWKYMMSMVERPVAWITQKASHAGRKLSLWHICWICIAWLAVSAYILARLFIFCEAFRQLFFLPPEAFRSTSWQVSFPHIG